MNTVVDIDAIQIKRLHSSHLVVAAVLLILSARLMVDSLFVWTIPIALLGALLIFIGGYRYYSVITAYPAQARDELTLANEHSAMRFALCAAIAFPGAYGIATGAIDLTFSAEESLHLMLLAVLVIGYGRFSFLELRAHDSVK